MNALPVPGLVKSRSRPFIHPSPEDYCILAPVHKYYCAGRATNYLPSPLSIPLPSILLRSRIHVYRSHLELIPSCQTKSCKECSGFSRKLSRLFEPASAYYTEKYAFSDAKICCRYLTLSGLTLLLYDYCLTVSKLISQHSSCLSSLFSFSVCAGGMHQFLFVAFSVPTKNRQVELIWKAPSSTISLIYLLVSASIHFPVRWANLVLKNRYLAWALYFLPGPVCV